MREQASDMDLDDIQLVLYTSNEDKISVEPQTDVGQELGHVSVSLWARNESENKEVPLFSFSEVGDWNSLNADVYENTSDERVSDEFIEAGAHAFDEDALEECFVEMSAVERFIFNSMRHAIVEMNHPEAMLVVEWCSEVYDDE